MIRKISDCNRIQLGCFGNSNFLCQLQEVFESKILYCLGWRRLKCWERSDWFVWWSLVCFAPPPLLCKPLALFAKERRPLSLIGKLLVVHGREGGKSSVSQISGWGRFWPRPAQETTHSMHRFLAQTTSLSSPSLMSSLRIIAQKMNPVTLTFKFY